MVLINSLIQFIQYSTRLCVLIQYSECTKGFIFISTFYLLSGDGEEWLKQTLQFV